MRTKIDHYFRVEKYGLQTVIKMKDVWCEGLFFKGIKIFHDSLPPNKTAYAISFNSDKSNFYIQKKDNSNNLFGTFVTGKRLPLEKDESVELEYIHNFEIALMRGEDSIRKNAQKHVLMNRIELLIKDNKWVDTVDFDWSLFTDIDLIPSAPYEKGKIQKLVIHKQGFELHCLKKEPTGYVRFARLYNDVDLPFDWLKSFEKELRSYFGLL